MAMSKIKTNDQVIVLCGKSKGKNQEVEVTSNSMVPTLIKGEYIMIDPTAYHNLDPKRNDIVTLIPPGNKKKQFILRIVGLPGEHVLINKKGLFINDILIDIVDVIYTSLGNGSQELFLKENEYCVLGDNTSIAVDSRVFGAVKRKAILGKFIEKSNSVNN